MDSVFFGSLVSGLKEIVKIEGEIKICSSTSDARKMLEHTRATAYSVFIIIGKKQ